MYIKQTKTHIKRTKTLIKHIKTNITHIKNPKSQIYIYIYRERERDREREREREIERERERGRVSVWFQVGPIWSPKNGGATSKVNKNSLEERLRNVTEHAANMSQLRSVISF